jgi:hypothetical protein
VGSDFVLYDVTIRPFSKHNIIFFYRAGSVCPVSYGTVDCVPTFNLPIYGRNYLFGAFRGNVFLFLLLIRDWVLLEYSVPRSSLLV